MDQIKISAKVLGQTALPDFCPRCFWIRLRMANKLPWQIFPGIFSSIDAYTKRVVHALIDKGEEAVKGSWLASLGDVVGYQKAPHFTKFKADFPEYGITLNGVVDDIFTLRSKGVIIPDYKTAKFTDTQDKLLPMYEVQLNGYRVIAESIGISPVEGLALVYMEPQTDEAAAALYYGNAGFSMVFGAHPVPILMDLGIILEAMRVTREIYDRPTAPDPGDGCKDCQALEGIISLL